ncbi:MAG: CdaR family protein [Streptococcaceae bacterium]|jgi:YbbR domain-containing protein|nr:CdaR family protein [Streptococcaceae bacterium]MCH4176743.1 CdaR family protein [Streptococcaceae bacterium]
MNKKNFLNSNIVYLFISFLFALLLFVNANATNIKNNVNQLSNLTTYDLTLHDIPVQVTYDDSKYFISGFDSNVSVYLTSYNRIRLDAERSDSTRSFSVVADLSKIQDGTVNVPLRLQGLASGVNGQIDPSQISVTVQKKASEEFEVTPVVNQSQLADNYTLDNITLSDKKVTVVSGSDMIKNIASIKATLPSDVVLNQDYNGEVTLKAYAEDGTEIPAEISPSKVTMEVNVTPPSKEVPLVAVQAGDLDDKVEQVSLQLSQSTAKIYGEQADLDKISQIKVAVDLTNITTKRTISQSLVADNVTVEPEKVKVTIIPVLKSDTDSSSN